MINIIFDVKVERGFNSSANYQKGAVSPLFRIPLNTNLT